MPSTAGNSASLEGVPGLLEPDLVSFLLWRRGRDNDAKYTYIYIYVYESVSLVLKASAACSDPDSSLPVKTE